MPAIKGFAHIPIYERNDDDWYVEPEWCVEGLFEKIPFQGMIHDPACGKGTIPFTAKRLGYKATGSDIVFRGYGKFKEIDFLDSCTFYHNIVMNPPYKQAEDFIKHSLKFAHLQIACLVRLAFLEGQKRKEGLYSEYPPTKVLVLSRRASMPPGNFEGKAEGGKVAYCWMVWDKNLMCEDYITELDWI